MSKEVERWILLELLNGAQLTMTEVANGIICIWYGKGRIVIYSCIKKKVIDHIDPDPMEHVDFEYAEQMMQNYLTKFK
jgi:hypothetical protein